MWLVALAVAALAIWLARGRRRLELRALAIGLVLVGLLMLAVRRFAGDYLVDELAKDDAVKPAAHDAWSILTQVLADSAWVWIILGVITLLGVWFVGETAAQPRRAAPPRPPGESPDDLRHRRRRDTRARPRAPAIADELVDGTRPDHPRRRGHRGRQKGRAGRDQESGRGIGRFVATDPALIRGGTQRIGSIASSGSDRARLPQRGRLARTRLRESEHRF